MSKRRGQQHYVDPIGFFTCNMVMFRPKPHCLLLASSIPHRAKSLSRSQPRIPLSKIG
jgi:hypothetical protein